MLTFLIFIAIGILFFLLSRSANLVIHSTKKIGHTFHIPIAFLGFLFGFFSSLPELSIAVNASAQNISDLSLGNLLGGLVVMYGLVLGISILFSRPISIRGDHSLLVPLFGYSLLPFLFGLNGEISSFEGALLVCIYFVLVFLLFDIWKEKETTLYSVQNQFPLKQIVLLFVGILLLLVISNILIRLSLTLFEIYTTSPFLIGFLFFGIGTNLPEILLSLRALRARVPELSQGTFFGLAMTNPLIVGILSLMRPVPIEKTGSHFILTISAALLFFFVFRFSQKNTITRKDGAILLLLYISTVLLQIIFI